MGRLFIEYLVSTGIYTCKDCSTPIANVEDVYKWDYKGPTGNKAYLFSKIVNVIKGESEIKNLMSG